MVAEPCMEKSSTTTKVAWNKKLADLTPMVVRINCNDNTRKLQEINTATFNFDSLIEFLCNAAFTESKYTDKQEYAQTGATEHWKCNSINGRV